MLQIVVPNNFILQIVALENFLLFDNFKQNSQIQMFNICFFFDKF